MYEPAGTNMKRLIPKKRTAAAPPREGDMHCSPTAIFALCSAIVIAVASGLGLYFFFKFKPKIFPEFTVEMASIYPLHFEPSNSTAGWYKVTGEWKLDFAVRNPNLNYNLTFSDMDVTIAHSLVKIVVMAPKGTFVNEYDIEWHHDYKIPGFNQTEKDSLTLVHAISLDKNRFPLVHDRTWAAILDRWISGCCGKQKIRVYLTGWMLAKKAVIKDDDEKENKEDKWQKLFVYCDLSVEFKATAAGVVGIKGVAAAPDDYCHTSLDGWW